MEKIMERLKNNKTVSLIKTAFISFTLLLSFIPLSSVADVNTNPTVTPENGYYFDLGSGQGGWQTDGLWHITTNRAYSPTHSFWYGDENTKTYNTEGANSGNLMSPAITLASNSQPVLYFWSWYQTENNKAYDKKVVQISVNDGQWTDLKLITDSKKTWNKEAIDLSGYAGNTIRLRFLFDTIDNNLNNYEGWYVDSIEISSGTISTATPALAPASTTTTTTPADTNMIANPSFENGDGSTPSNWVFRTQNRTPIWDMSVSHNGTKSVKISIPGTTPRVSGQVLGEYVGTAPNTKFVISAWGKGNGLGWSPPQLIVDEFDSNHNYLRYTAMAFPRGTYDWTYKETTIVTGANTAYVRVYSHINNGYGTFWFDDISLIQNDQPTPTPTPTATQAPTSTPTPTPTPTPSPTPTPAPTATQAPTSTPTPSPTATPAPTSTPGPISNGPTYYVATNGNDGNSGSSSSPWRTIQHAADTASAGATVYVMGGTYNQKVTVTKSGSSGNYITFAAYPGQTATIDGTGVSLGSWDGLIRINGASYIKISGFRIVKSSYTGIMVSGGNPSSIIIENNYINGAYSSGIYAERASDVTIDNNEVTGAHTAGQGTHNEIISLVQVNGFDVKNNKVHDNANTESINAKIGSSNGRIHHNNIKPTASAGIYLDAYTGNEQSIEVYSNTVHDGPGGSRGIAAAVEGGGTLKKVKIYNNMVYKNGANGIVVDYYASCGSDPGTPCISGTIDDIQIIGNTVYQNNAIGWEGGIVNKYDKATNVVIRNNIVSQNNKAQILVKGSGNIVENNLIDGSGGTTGSSYVTGNPQFVDPSSGNFHIQSTSPAIDKGTSTGAPAVDYDGDSRPQGAGHDMGADEHPH